jgi:2-polyprenyl-3-methyl-5-hydroxy-6-metoxy-1,4-benzoquinol methylase
MIGNESLDLIVASEVFEHTLPRYRRNTLRMLYNKLKPGGVIVITAPNRLHPKDTRTTGLWFTAWLPARIGTAICVQKCLEAHRSMGSMAGVAGDRMGKAA